MYGYNVRSNYQYREVYNPSSMQYEVEGTPRNAPAAPTAGHWRTAATDKAPAKPRLQPRPTSGRNMPKCNPGPKRKRKPAKPQAPTAKEIHSMWARGKLEF